MKKKENVSSHKVASSDPLQYQKYILDVLSKLVRFKYFLVAYWKKS